MTIDRFLAAHDGVVSRAQARACGLTDRQIDRRVERGAWLPRAHAVYFAVAWPWTAAARVRVAAEWSHPAGTLLALAAAWWLGLGVESPHPIEVGLPPQRRRRPPPGVTTWRRDLQRDRFLHRGLWVTSRPLTVLDAAVALGAAGRPFLDRALQRHVTLDELRAAQNRHLGRRGSGAAGRLLARAGDRTASEAERLFVAILRGAGLAGWVVNLEYSAASGLQFLIDVAFPEVRLAIEVDGWAHHVDPDSFVRDRRRKRALVAEGWTVIEVSWDDLVNRPQLVIADIRRIVLRLSAGCSAG